MQTAWTVGIRLVASSNFGLISSNMARQAAGAEKSVGGLRRSISGLEPAARAANMAITGMGVAAAATFALGVQGASDLQNATLQSAVAMGRLGDTLGVTMARMRDFRQVALEMSKMTGQSMADSMNVVARMSSAGLTPQLIKTDAKPIAQFGDILRMGKDQMSYQDSAVLGSGLIHDLRLFNAADTTYGLGRIAQLGYLSPHGTNALTTQIRRMASPLENVLPGTVQQRADQITLLAAWSDRMGVSQFSGSAISQMLTQMIAPRSAHVAQGLEDLGVYSKGHQEGRKYIPGRNLFWDSKTQTFDLMGALNQVQRAVAAGRLSGNDEAMKALFSGTQNMQRILTALTSKESLTAYANLRAQMTRMGNPVAWMNKTQSQLMGTLSGQTLLLTSNFRTLSTLLVDGLIPSMTKVVGFAQTTVGGWNQFLMDHPRAAKQGGELLALGGLAGLLNLLRGGENWIRAIVTLGRDPHAWLTASHRAQSAGEVARVASGGREFGIVGGLIRGIGGMLGLANLRGAFSDLGRVFSLFKTFGAEIVTTRGGLSLLGEIVGRLGLRIIPIVGELFLLKDALTLLVGGMAWAFGWINQHLGIKPGQHGARTTLHTGWNPAAAPVGGYHPRGTLSATLQRTRAVAPVVKSVAGMQLPRLPLPATLQRTRAVAPVHLAAPAPAPAGGYRGRGHGPTTIHNVVTVNAPYHAAPNMNDADSRRAALNHARTITGKVAEVMSDVARTSGRAAGVVPAMAGASHYEFGSLPG